MVRIYGSQKGVHSYKLQIFKDLIQRWGNLLTTASNQRNFELKGGGANGGITAVIVALIQKTLHTGTSFFI